MGKDKRHISSICLNCFSTLNKFGFCPNCHRKAGTTAVSPLALQPGTVLEKRYLLGYPLGMGGFGITYGAWDIEDSERIAIKEFFPQGYAARVPNSTHVTMIKHEYIPAFNHWLAAFIDEAEVLTSIAHLSGIVHIEDFFFINNTAYIAMEYLDGISLRQYLTARGGKLPLKETLSVMRPCSNRCSLCTNTASYTRT